MGFIDSDRLLDNFVGRFHVEPDSVMGILHDFLGRFFYHFIRPFHFFGPDIYRNEADPRKDKGGFRADSSACSGRRNFLCRVGLSLFKYCDRIFFRILPVLSKHGEKFSLRQGIIGAPQIDIRVIDRSRTAEPHTGFLRLIGFLLFIILTIGRLGFSVLGLALHIIKQIVEIIIVIVIIIIFRTGPQPVDDFEIPLRFRQEQFLLGQFNFRPFKLDLCKSRVVGKKRITASYGLAFLDQHITDFLGTA